MGSIDENVNFLLGPNIAQQLMQFMANFWFVFVDVCVRTCCSTPQSSLIVQRVRNRKNYIE